MVRKRLASIRIKLELKQEIQAMSFIPMTYKLGEEFQATFTAFQVVPRVIDGEDIARESFQDWISG